MDSQPNTQRRGEHPLTHVCTKPEAETEVCVCWMPLSGTDNHCREVCFCASTEVPSLCFLHNNVWLYSLLSECSFAVQLILGIVSEDGESAFHRVCILCAITILVNSSNPLQQFPRNWHTKCMWYLLEVNPQAAQPSLREPHSCTKFPLRIQQLHLTLFSSKHRESWLGICSTYPPFFSLIFTHTVSFSILHKSPFKIAKRKTQLTPSTCWMVCFMADHWMGPAGNPEQGFSIRTTGSGVSCSYGQNEVLFACSPAI
jgi:hypothetical protein